MHFVFYGKDKKGALQVRVDNRPTHVEWLKSNPIVLAGPMLDENGDMSGSMVCLLYTSPSPRDLSTSRMPSSA